jgi:hypothetical protein
VTWQAAESSVQFCRGSRLGALHRAIDEASPLCNEFRPLYNEDDAIDVAISCVVAVIGNGTWFQQLERRFSADECFLLIAS